MKRAAGRIEVASGPMFASKSSWLFREFRKHHLAMREVLLLKSRLDTRYNSGPRSSVSHDGQRFPAISVGRVEEAGDPQADVIGVDEGQFMGEGLEQWASRQAGRGKTVLVACLDCDFRMRPFDNVAPLLCVAESHLKLTAICAVCGGDAHYTRRTSSSTDTVEIGTHQYLPVCRQHHATELQDTAEYMRRVRSIPGSKQ